MTDILGGNRDIENKLKHAVTEYDRKELARHIRNPRAYHNPNALGMYLDAANEANAEILAGTPVRAALVNHFCGRLLDVVLKSVGEAKSTDQEQRINGKFGF